MSVSPVELATVDSLADDTRVSIRKRPQLRLQCPTKPTIKAVPEVKAKCIKLCTIEPGTRHDPIHCTLTPAILDTSMLYRCLSYVWGSADDKEMIVLDGKAHAVTRNLYVVLKSFRDSAGLHSPIWIDALCIDQKDEEDKRVQVAMMGEIYTMAEEVLVWLGAEPVAGVAAGLVDILDQHPVAPVGAVSGSQIEEVMSLLAADTHFHDLPIHTYCKSRRCPAISGGIAKGSHTWSEVLELLKSWFDVAWYERAWTVQEIVLAKKATLCLGSQRLPWATASKAWINVERHMRTCCTECIHSLPAQDPLDISRMVGRIIDFSSAREKMERGQHLIEPLLQFSWKQASDPRDKLYGLLGLQSGETQTAVVPDYTSSLQQVFSRFAADVIRSQGWLIPLCLSLTQQLPGLPSWVPDWTVTSSIPALYTNSRFSWSHTYAAAEGFTGRAYVSDDFVLAVDGLRFDAIASLGEAYVIMENFADQQHVLESWKEYVDLATMSKSKYPAGSNLREAFWRTMFADRFQEYVEPRKLEVHDVRHLWKFLKEARKSLQDYGDDVVIGLNDAMSSHLMAVVDRRLFQTTKSWFGLCPKTAKAGDEVFVLGDCPAPVILRKLTDGNNDESRYTVIGHCYLHGIMCGKAVRMELPRVRVHIV